MLGRRLLAARANPEGLGLNDLVACIDTAYDPFDPGVTFNVESPQSAIRVFWGDGTTENFPFEPAGQIISKSFSGDPSVRSQVRLRGVSGRTKVGGSFSDTSSFEACTQFGKMCEESASTVFSALRNLRLAPSRLPPNVTSAFGTFASCENFNQDIPDFVHGNVTDISEILGGCSSFNGSVANWDTSGVNSAAGAFISATSFNQPVNHFVMDSVLPVESMFSNATAFNQPLNNWKTSSFTSAFNMFADTPNFNQDLSGWCVPQYGISVPGGIFGGSGISPGNLPNWGACPDEALIASPQLIGTFQGVNSANIIGGEIGDVLIVFAFRDGSSTPPTAPAGSFEVAFISGFSCGARVYAVDITSGSSFTTTATNATGLVALLYRNVDTAALRPGGPRLFAADRADATTSVRYMRNDCWKDKATIIYFAGHRSVNTNLQNAPAGVLLRENFLNATNHVVAFSSSAAAGAVTQQDIAVGGTQSGWITSAVRLKGITA